MLPSGKNATVEARSPEDQTAQIQYEDGRTYTYNLATLFEFRTDLATANARHPALQQFWETLAVDLIFRSREFEEHGYAKWWAHSRRYARYVLRLTAQRDTIELVKDWVIILFSSDVTPEVQHEHAVAAWKGFLIERHGSDAAADRAIATGKAVPLDGFKQDMYVYAAAGWSYERVMETHRWLEEQAEKVKSIARTLQDRSFKMHEFTELEKAKYGNIGPLTVDELVDQVAQRVLKVVGGKGGAGTIGFDEAHFMQTLRPNDTRQDQTTPNDTRQDQTPLSTDDIKQT